MIERAAETLGDELVHLQELGSKAADQLVKDSRKVTKRARYRLRNGASRAVEIERRIASDLQTHPLAYLLVALGLAGVIGLKIVFDRRRNGRND